LNLSIKCWARKKCALSIKHLHDPRPHRFRAAPAHEMSFPQSMPLLGTPVHALHKPGVLKVTIQMSASSPLRTRSPPKSTVHTADRQVPLLEHEWRPRQATKVVESRPQRTLSGPQRLFPAVDCLYTKTSHNRALRCPQRCIHQMHQRGDDFLSSARQVVPSFHSNSCISWIAGRAGNCGRNKQTKTAYHVFRRHLAGRITKWTGTNLARAMQTGLAAGSKH